MYSYSDLEDITFGIATFAIEAEQTPASKKTKNAVLPVLPEGERKAKVAIHETAEKKPMRATVAQYSAEERSRGGISTANRKREKAHDSIDQFLAIYVADLENANVPKARFVLIHFVRGAMPWLKNPVAAVRRYGDYIKARLVSFSDRQPVMNLASLINKMRQAVAKRLGRAMKAMFSEFPGVLHRLASNAFKTSHRHSGAWWLPKFGIWGFFEDADTGECFEA